MTGLPSDGHRLCRLDSLGESAARAFVFGRGGHRFEIFVQRWNGRLFAYLNACPHAGLPLDWKPGQFIGPDGKHLMCANHGALFRIDDGFCIAGPCKGERLKSVPIRVERGFVVISGPDWPE